jgi:hypothetical protein
MDYKARMYDPYLNRWTQPDTIIPDQNNSQDWNRYTYANNNPVKYNDPTGHGICDDMGHCYLNPGDRRPTKNLNLFQDINLSSGSKSIGTSSSGGNKGNSANSELTQSSNGTNSGSGTDNCTGLQCLQNNDDNGTSLSNGNSGDIGICGKKAILAGVELAFTGVVDTALVGALMLGFPESLILLPMDIIAIDLTVYDVQEFSQANTRPCEDMDVDTLYFIHLIIPNFLKDY